MDKTGLEKLQDILENDTTLRDSDGHYYALLWGMAQKRCEDEKVPKSQTEVWFNGFVRGVESVITLDETLGKYERGEDEVSQKFRRIQVARKGYDSDSD